MIQTKNKVKIAIRKNSTICWACLCGISVTRKSKKSKSKEKLKMMSCTCLSKLILKRSGWEIWLNFWKFLIRLKKKNRKIWRKMINCLKEMEKVKKLRRKYKRKMKKKKLNLVKKRSTGMILIKIRLILMISKS